LWASLAHGRNLWFVEVPTVETQQELPIVIEKSDADAAFQLRNLRFAGEREPLHGKPFVDAFDGGHMGSVLGFE
jgi:hypothetical protein